MCVNAKRPFLYDLLIMDDIMDRKKLDEIVNIVNQTLMTPDEKADQKYECIEADWLGNEKTLRLYIDSSRGMTLDSCVACTRILNNLKSLDESIPGTYRLEVSSPGLERPLRRREHFERHLGAVVQVRLQEKFHDRRNGVGKLVSISNEEGVVLETPQGRWSFPFDQIYKASLVYDWGSVKNQ